MIGMHPGEIARANISPERISEMQQALPQCPATPSTREDFQRVARWWELEAARNHPSRAASLWYAANMLLAAERRAVEGPSPWTPGADMLAPRCAKCGGPSTGPYPCCCPGA